MAEKGTMDGMTIMTCSDKACFVDRDIMSAFITCLDPVVKLVGL